MQDETIGFHWDVDTVEAMVNIMKTMAFHGLLDLPPTLISDINQWLAIENQMRDEYDEHTMFITKPDFEADSDKIAAFFQQLTPTRLG